MSENPSGHQLPRWDLADRLRKALRESGLGVQDAAERLGVSRNTVSSYINGRQAPDRRTLVAWSWMTGVDLGWLENGTSAPPPGPGRSVNFKGSVNSGNMSLFRLAA